jgi:hypothetical protein
MEELNLAKKGPTHCTTKPSLQKQNSLVNNYIEDKEKSL